MYVNSCKSYGEISSLVIVKISKLQYRPQATCIQLEEENFLSNVVNSLHSYIKEPPGRMQGIIFKNSYWARTEFITQTWILWVNKIFFHGYAE